MPDKRNVTVGFRSREQDGGSERSSSLGGQLHKLSTGWVLTYREPPDEESAVETLNTLFVREKELMLRRRGTIFLEQTFRLGELLPGKLETPYGPHDVKALTNRLNIDLSETGGIIEWKYDLLMQDQTVGSFHIRLDIREEQAG